MAPRLFRGACPKMHAAFDGRLRPKDHMPFTRSPVWDHAEWDNAFWGECEANAVVEHQQHQAGHPTSGVSFTPHRHRAQYYAMSGGSASRGYIYVVHTAFLSAYGVTAHVVNAVVPKPSVPEDDEVILVARDFGPLPREIIVEVLECGT